jgi:transposase InsO family protein
LRFTGPEIAETLDMALSTVSGILTRIGMGKLGRLGLEPAVRYERERPGELIHIDVKKLGRIQGGAGKRVRDGRRRHAHPKRTDAAGVRRETIGWEYVHIAIDDATRLAYAEVLTDEKATTAVAFLRRATQFYARHGIHVQALLTDNGSPYVSITHAAACRLLGIRHLRTRPYRPQTNGKAERFIQCRMGIGTRDLRRRGPERYLPSRARRPGRATRAAAAVVRLLADTAVPGAVQRIG